MGKKPVCLTVLVIVLMGVLGASFNVHKVEAPYPIIYIRADGSIDPSTANITSSDNVTYTFTADINASIVIEKNNTVVTGAGYTLQGVGGGTGIDLSNTNNVTLQNIQVSNFTHGIGLTESSYNTITGNTASNNSNGIYLWSSSNNMIIGNTALNNGDGVFFYLCYNNTITGNTISNNTSNGIQLYSSNHNTITGNTASNNRYGIFLYGSSNNTVTGNTVSSSNWDGIHLLVSSNNAFFHNNLIDNANNFEVSLANPNVLDNGIEGNYWSNYTGVDLNHDGIGDTEHVIDANNTDRYPLMGMFHSFNTSLGKSVNIISNSTVDSFQHESPGTIRFHVSNTTASQTHGFCRVSIHNDVLSAPFNVTVDGANPTFWNYTLYDNGTHRWIHFEYEHTTREIVIIPEFPSFFTLPLFMTATLMIAILFRRRKSFNSDSH